LNVKQGFFVGDRSLAGVASGTERIQRYEICYFHQTNHILFDKVGKGEEDMPI
jgi:hypothetical protein